MSADSITQYDRLYRLYEEYDVERLREYQDYVDVFPPLDSQVALEHWQQAKEALETFREQIADGSPAEALFADIAARATREQAFTALDLYSKYGRAVNALVLDVDETLRSTGKTDNEIPRETLHLLRQFHEDGVPIIICTGQTLENVKGFLIQGLGNELVHSGNLSIVYEAGNGVFTPGHGSQTKRLLYEDLDEAVGDVFDTVRSRVFRDAPDDIKRGCHLQGNEFNVTLKPNFETGSPQAETVIDRGLVHLLRTLNDAVTDREEGFAWARCHYANADPEIEQVLTKRDLLPDITPESIPTEVRGIFEQIDVAYYHADAAEIGSLELDKSVGVEAALSVLGIDDPFALVMGDSKSDLRVMEWLNERDAGLGAAPEHASADVLEFVNDTDELVFKPGNSGDVLRMAYALNRLSARPSSTDSSADLGDTPGSCQH
jgi:hydroxymethylpyrimidine pyrophosphatase-like HAD family hydrolase